ncbi:hypothetical protein Poli38472_006494 [Pythium oligandrum]|uniref:Elicitin-like protein n=1 Tax=Pythium oligandrum TaxID=41045 RepID=A0A8K1C4P9_PYTOL|nr:hypothetical protein Poli38472_006494 [Pythium oligandrum]|eukprot:TMW56484.1 hypothetical protein Poli38472_006494 [Pythium oligandrum]
MKLSTIVSTLAITVGSAAYAEECSNEHLTAIRPFEPSATSDCGSDIQGLFAYSGSSSIILCSKCVETLDSIAKYFPDCTINGASFSNMSMAIAQYCENEYNSTDGSNSGSISTEKPDCSSSEKTKITNLRSDPAMKQACGDYDTTGNITKVCTSDCSAYIKDKYIPELPDCSLDGVDVKAWAIIKVTYCELPPDTAGSHTIAGTVALAGLAVAALVMV